ncbi:MAG: hypothetical protein RLY21_1928 [Planctomycetota bacterium]
MELEDGARVVRETAHDADVDRAPLEDAHARRVRAEFIERGEFVGRDADLRGEFRKRRRQGLRRARGDVEARDSVGREPERTRALRELLGLQLVAPVEERHRVGGLVGGHAECREHARDRGAVRDAHLDIARREAEALEREDAASNHIEVMGRALDSGDVDVPLEELAQAAALRALGAEHRGNREPLDGNRQRTGVRRDHARERRRELGAQRVVALAAGAAEREELVDDPFA